jgi:cyclopropane-fatty-acyl-phospholipid synthase
MQSTAIDRWAQDAFFAALAELRHGLLTVRAAGLTRTFGNGAGHAATLEIHDRVFFARVIAGGEIALGDTYMDGIWTTPDLVPLVRLMLANRGVFAKLPAWLSWAPRLAEQAAHWRRDNSRAGSRRNIHEHYDLGNRFFQLFLDPNLMYSCAVYEDADDSLAAAQVNKLRGICERLDLQPGDRVLEIGTGWGGFALFAATRYGCHVTTTTISVEQHDHAARLIAGAGEAGRRIDLRCEDYRELQGRFDKIVSIEMFEAVGLKHYDEFFGACDRLLTPEGAMLMQTITVDDWRFAEYLNTPSWIAKRIFPGSELASVAEILASLSRVSRLSLFHAQQIGTHYARTLHQWRERFHERLDEVRALGFDARFARMWDLYLGYCEAAFQDRHIGNVQLLLTKSAITRSLPGEPWHRASQSSALEPTAQTSIAQ